MFRVTQVFIKDTLVGYEVDVDYEQYCALLDNLGIKRLVEGRIKEREGQQLLYKVVYSSDDLEKLEDSDLYIDFNRPVLIDTLLKKYRQGGQFRIRMGNRSFVVKMELLPGLLPKIKRFGSRLKQAFLLLLGKGFLVQFKQDTKEFKNVNIVGLKKRLSRGIS